MRVINRITLGAMLLCWGTAHSAATAQSAPIVPAFLLQSSTAQPETRPKKAQKEEFGGQERLVLNNGLGVPASDQDGTPAQAMGNGWVSYGKSSGRFLVLKPLEGGGVEFVRTYPGEPRETWTLQSATTADVVAILGGASQAMLYEGEGDPFLDDEWMAGDTDPSDFHIPDDSMDELEQMASDMFEESDEFYDDFFMMDEESIDEFVEQADDRNSFQIFLEALGNGVVRDLTFSINKQGEVFIGVKKVSEYDPMSGQSSDYFVMGNGERVPTILEGSKGQISIDTSEIIYGDGAAVYVDMRTGDTVYRRADGSELRKEPALAEIFLSFIKRAIDGGTAAAVSGDYAEGAQDDDMFEDYMYESGDG